jgi:hypothetical protein
MLHTRSPRSTARSAPRLANLATLIALTTSAALVSTQSHAASVEITTPGHIPQVVSYVGFIHGFSHPEEPPYELVATLGVRSWRIKEYDQYIPAAKHTSNITMILSDTWLHLAETGQIPSADPSYDWGAWETFVDTFVSYSLKNGRPITSWEIWNEPDRGAFWSVNWSYDVLLEAFARAADVIRKLDPNATIMGPSFANFDGYYTVFPEGASSVHVSVDQFIADLDSGFGVRLDAIAWHENEGDPFYIRAHADAARAAASAMDPSYAPILTINEYNAPRLHFSPVSVALHIHELDGAGIDFASLACWDAHAASCGSPPYSTCWAGLNGLLAPDTGEPLAPYWIYEWHGDEKGHRLGAEADDPTTKTLASFDVQAQRARVMVTRFNHNGLADDVRLTLRGLDFATSRVSARVATLRDSTEVCGDDLPVSAPAPTRPEEISLGDIEIVNGDVTVDLPNLPDMSVTFVTIDAADPSLDPSTLPAMCPDSSDACGSNVSCAAAPEIPSRSPHGAALLLAALCARLIRSRRRQCSNARTRQSAGGGSPRARP